MPSGGDIIEITFNHPTLGSGTLSPKAAEDSTYNLGGIRSADDNNMIDGRGEMIDQMTRARWSLEAVIGWDMTTKNLEKVIAMAGSPVLATWTFTLINNVVYRGKGKPVGDIQGNANNATFPLKVSGGGKLEKI